MLRELRRLNWGCGLCAAPGWINADVRAGQGVDLVGDIRSGLALDSDSMQYIVAIHVLQDLSYTDIPIALKELRRVLVPAGVLRLGLPDLDQAIRAYLADDHAYFYVPDCDAQSIGTKLVTQLVWYGSVRTPLTFDCMEEWLLREGFHDIRRYPDAQHLPGLLLFRWDAPLFFANAEFFKERVMAAIAESPTPVRRLVIAAEPVTSVDVTSADMLTELMQRLNEAGTEMCFAEMKDPVKDKLKRFGLFAQFGDKAFFPTIGSAVKNYVTMNPVGWSRP